MASRELFSPANLGAIALKNRIVMAPLTRSRADDHGVPAEFAPDYYGPRASAGMIITAATQASFEGMGYPRTPGIHTPEQIASWQRVVDAVHAHGGKIVLQIWHVGRIASHLNRGVPADVVAPSAIQAPGKIYTDEKGMVDHDVPRALATHEIAEIAQEFAAGAQTAIATGFDGVEIHSANGYLLHQFLSSNVNQRTDRYGGSISNRVAMPLEVISAVLKRVPHDRVGVRVSPGHTFNGIEEGDTNELYRHYLGELNAFNLAYLHVMRPSANHFETDPVDLARSVFKGPIIAAGGYDAQSACTLIAKGGADAVAFGRAFIANPDLVERIAQGAPLNKPNEATFYTPGREGYTDYPWLSA